ncbi:tRNA lysidine(34) synthetase TilS [Yoonia sp.]|uniref:tRNA lysidine(34) synthetase TilS n=1 Tax=Yoonia sp. TaxID=2212373 RepID=UPI0035C80AAC
MSVGACFAQAIAQHPVSGDRPIGLAVSGGGDSIAMMHLAARSLAVGQLHVLSIDHGLRPEAAQELALVNAQAQALGLQHHVGHWSWDGTGNLQAAARAGRWQALCALAARHELGMIWMGHTQDDQIETFLMRLARGSGVDGLAAMRMRATRGGMPLLRPLLEAKRADLRAWLRQQGISWADDPSNADARYDRVRARHMAGELADLGLTPKRVLQTIDHMNAARATLEQAAHQFAAAHVHEDRGDLLLAPEVLGDMTTDQNRRVLAAALGWINGRAFRPRFDQLMAAAESLGKGQTATLAGCILCVDTNNRIRIAREAAATAPRDVLETGLSIIWDSRWRLSGPLRDGLTVKALGSALIDCPEWRASGIPRSSLLASPAIWDGETLLAAPLAGFANGWSAQIVADFHSSAFAIED